jgi:hypothetical protein
MPKMHNSKTDVLILLPSNSLREAPLFQTDALVRPLLRMYVMLKKLASL